MWIVLSVIAAVFQTARNGLARSLTAELSPLLISWSRFAFNLPLSLALAWWIARRSGWPVLSAPFLLFCFATATTQLLGNVALVEAFRHASFARSIVLHKLEVVFAALVGVALFAERPSLLGWVGISVCGLGTVALNLGRGTSGVVWRQAFRLDRGAALSIAAGVLLVVTGFTLKDATAALRVANPELAGSGLVSAAFTLFHTVWMQVLLLSGALLLRRPHELRALARSYPRMSAIGATGFCASLCWFWAYPLTLVAYVKAVGQVEGVLSVALSLAIWREAEVWRQLPGMALVLFGILLVLVG